MKIARKFTKAGENPFETVQWTRRSSKISNPDGSVVFEMKDAEVPEAWSQLATDIMVSKYFRKAGVPQDGGPNGIASPGFNSKKDAGVTGPERSAKQVIHRLAGCWRHWGETHGYFDSAEDAQAFEDELKHMLVHQMCAPNSPQWFNTGLNWAYGISGPAQGHWIVDPKTGEAKLADDAYTHPQPHACFIQSVSDDLVNEGGIMDLWVREARLFKYGSGTGSNFSHLRGEGEALSGGGKSSGLMSWLRIGDRAASAIKSGGTTRRAAKMVCLDMDHPDIETFINWKVREEIKVAALVEGLRAIAGQRTSINDAETVGETAARLGLKLDYDFNGEAYATVAGQNSNNSVRIPDSFFDALDKDGEWKTTWRTTGEIARTYSAKKLWDEIGYAAWRCADPGVQFDSTINAWHTCPSAGQINASNPCSEYMFLDDTACNLASLNVLKFFDVKTGAFDVERFEHAIDLWTIVLEISVLMASFPSRRIAELSYRYRTLGLGYANLGAMLMQAGVAYDSDEARGVCAVLTAILTGRSYRMSAEMARELGAFPGYDADKDNMLRVVRNHRRAAHGVSRESGKYESLRIPPVPVDHELMLSGKVKVANAAALLDHAVLAWDEALELGEKFGYRNAQTTVIAPTGTIGLLMDCDTTGVEPDFALVKFKKLAGGGYFKIANESVRPALRTLGYTDAQIAGIMAYLLGTLSLGVPMPDGVKDAKGQTLAQWLAGKGLNDAELAAITAQLPGVFELKYAFGAWGFSDDTLKRCGLDPAKARTEMGFNLLRALGLSDKQVEALNTLVCGTQTVEGAPHLKPEHLPVFDCANTCGAIGTRFIRPEGHIRMMAAAQPFISGAISKTINLPNSASVSDITACYRLSWELGLKANALYRDGCKLSQPLSTKVEDAAAKGETSDDAMEAELEKSEVSAAAEKVVAAVAASDAPAASEAQRDLTHRPMRRRLPDTRRSVTHKFNIAGHEGYLTVGCYEDGSPGELFITMAKEGSTIGGLMDSLGTSTSVALQYGVPLESLVRKFTHQRFEPAGMTTNSDIPFAKSLVDYIFRWMGMQFIPGYREANAPQRGSKGDKRVEAKGAPRIAGAERHTMTRAKEERVAWLRSESAEGGSHDDSASGASDAKSPTGASGGATDRELTLVVSASTLSVALESAGDAPPCDYCGTITVRSGTCYKCLNCGASLGCS
ncbi:MAG: adenosylcobalamin-dependent ribonucleoside-diphosphate reductase [Phycisphaerales bacterium]|nr:adenosylcobalamin-dependent ribonucleoside-diphosphate reductase [Phycisphaerales bacterium]